MHPYVGIFARQVLLVGLASLMPVVFAAFVSIPMALGSHPGEARNVAENAPAQHMT